VLVAGVVVVVESQTTKISIMGLLCFKLTGEGALVVVEDFFLLDVSNVSENIKTQGLALSFPRILNLLHIKCFQ
jgi:hypothetical protein